MLTINKYTKETLDRSSITIIDKYKGIVDEKAKDINNVKALTMMLYKTIYYYLDDARRTLEQLTEIIESWGEETGIDITSIIDEIKHTEDMIEVVEKITDDSYGDDDSTDTDTDTDNEIERKIEGVIKETEEVVEVIKENPELKEEVKEEVKEEAKIELPPSTPTTPATPEEAKSDARQDAADAIRSRGEEGGITYIREDPTNPIERAASDIINTVIDIITETKTGEAVPSDVTTSTTREAGLDAAAAVIERGGTAEEAVGAYVDAVTIGGQVGGDGLGTHLGYDDESRETINDDIQAIIDAVNEAAAAESNSNNPGSETPGSSSPSEPTECGSDECPSDAYCDCTSDGGCTSDCSGDCSSDCSSDCSGDCSGDCGTDTCTSDCSSDCPSDCGVDIPCGGDICAQDCSSDCGTDCSSDCATDCSSDCATDAYCDCGCDDAVCGDDGA